MMWVQPPSWEVKGRGPGLWAIHDLQVTSSGFLYRLTMSQPFGGRSALLQKKLCSSRSQPTTLIGFHAYMRHLSTAAFHFSGLQAQVKAHVSWFDSKESPNQPIQPRLTNTKTAVMTLSWSTCSTALYSPGILEWSFQKGIIFWIWIYTKTICKPTSTSMIILYNIILDAVSNGFI